MWVRFYSSLIILFLAFLLSFPTKSQSQIVRATGNATEASTQLIYYYDQDGGDTELQVTNTNDTQGVWIHVQIFRNDDPDEIDNNGDEIICDERDFVDFLTPNDTHEYDFDPDIFVANMGETEVDPGDEINIDVTSTKGFVVITPVVSETDFTAIAFQHLIGHMADEGGSFRENAMGRDALDLATGEVLADGTPLDGISTGLVLLQPEELIYEVVCDSDVDVVGITLTDNYGPPGLLGYQVMPGNATWTSFIFDYKEDPTSCGDTPVSCFTTLGINSEDFPQGNTNFLEGLLCDGTDIPDEPGSFGDEAGWVRSFVSGLSGNENHVGFIYESCITGGRWMNTNKDEEDKREIQAPTGISSRASSQLIYYYDTTEAHQTFLQVTNTNDSKGVWVHVQIFRSFDTDTTPLQDGDEVICDERNFVDFLTPNDTHVYYLAEPNFTKNVGETDTDPGEMTSINADGSKGFVIITPVVSEADLTAKSFQYLIGTARDWNQTPFFSMNAMGRDAVDFSTGEILSVNTPLDGISNGFVRIHPEEFLFDFGANTDEPPVNVVGIAFTDNYGPPGLLGYGAVPADATWTSFIFDYKEDPTSCGDRAVNCFITVGLNDSFLQSNEEISQDDLLCSGAETPLHPEVGIDSIGWTRTFISGLDMFENHIGIFMTEQLTGASYMFVRGNRVFGDVEPPAEDCALEGDEDEDGFADCLDTDCATAEECETGAEECADGMDNDEDGQADCADLGCDGFAGCEFGTEVSCEDGIDNDGDGAVDADDTDCQASDDGGTGDGGDGGGCTVAPAVTATTAAANFLLPLLPLFGAYGIRRIRNRGKIALS